MAELIGMSFCMKTRLSPRNHRGADPHGKRQFSTVVRAIHTRLVGAAVPVTPPSRSLQKGSIANNVMQQKGSFSMAGKRK